jgi:mono/diheme cytochrome c family protein
VKLWARLGIVGVIVFALLQVVRSSIPEKPATAELQAPPEVRQVLQQSCYSCHSDQPRLSWFDHIVPGYWLVRHDILTARRHLNFSTLGNKPAAAQKGALYEAVNMVQLGAMPLPRFLMLHPGAKVTADELTTLKAYLAPFTASLPVANPHSGEETQARVSLTAIAPEFNGLAFDPDFENWKPLSTTDRGDNNTFRFILGNGVAVKAAQTGNISPWPDGARFAKVAWQKEVGTDGLLRPGKFVQVELMVKNAQQYRDNEGWGFGRWRGLDLKPYGKDAGFVNECTGCHRPMQGNDYVYTMPMTAARATAIEVVNNAAAALPAGMPYQPLSWNAITMYVDPRLRTTATLYGNPAAIQAVRARGTYPAVAVLALVTWAQRGDPHWFGARIPDRPLSVEFVHPGEAQPGYQRFSATGPASDEALMASERTKLILSLTPASLP